MTEALDLERLSLGSTTWRREDLLRGVEADSCFYIQNERRVRGRDLDLAVDPPPDLAIEIDITRKSLPRLPIYAALGVPELWRYDDGVLEFLGLDADGEYRPIERSAAFPIVTARDLQRFLELRGEHGETTIARRLRSWLRDRLA